jgi:hypothetical protein
MATECRAGEVAARNRQKKATQPWGWIQYDLPFADAFHSALFFVV